MAKRLLIVNGLLINEGKKIHADLLIEGTRIARIDKQISTSADEIIDASGLYVLPGVIDDQVHFREPGYPQSGSIASESRAAIAGGVTSYMEMPNTLPPTTTHELLEEKYAIAAHSSFANYSFYMGTTHDNMEEAIRVNPRKVCGIKVFMGSSTGNMLVEDPERLQFLFKHAPVVVAIHGEQEAPIREALSAMRAKYGADIPMQRHPEIRNAAACYAATSQAVSWAKKYGTRLNVLHISTKDELSLFSSLPLSQKNITAEVCVHHLCFSREDYHTKGGYLKTNPAIKGKEDRAALWAGLLSNQLDIIASDHSPHTAYDKEKVYTNCPSGMPLVGHSLLAMLEKTDPQNFPIARLVEKMCHAPAKVYRIWARGFLREGYYADIVIVDPRRAWQLREEDIHYKVGWSIFLGNTFRHKIAHTVVSGHLAYSKGIFSPERKAQRLEFSSP